MKRTEAIKSFLASEKAQGHLFERDDPLYIKVCNTTSFDSFMSSIDVRKIMFWNEIIWAHLPARMYMDCEYKNLDAPGSIDLDSYINLIHQQVQSCVQHVAPNLEPPLVLVGSRKYVFSVHLIWPTLWCATPEPIKQIAELVREKRIMNVEVDLGVYPDRKEKPRTLRMPFCGKLKDPGAGLMLPYVDKQLVSCFDADLFSRYLISFHQEHSGTHVLPRIPDSILATLGTTSAKKYRAGDTVDFDPETQIHVLNWMEFVHPLFERRNFQMREDGSWSCYGVMYCPNANRWHKSNSMYVNSDAFGVITCACADYNCKVPVRHSATEQEVRVANTPWKVDWETIKKIVN